MDRECQEVLDYIRVDSPDEGSLERRIDIVAKLYKQALQEDQIFLQILNQIKNHPNVQCLIRAWELMYMCASCMLPPKEDIRELLSNYIRDVVDNRDTNTDVKVFATKTQKALNRSVKAGPRHSVPCREEIEARLIGNKLPTKVFFLDGTFEEISYDMATTVSDAIKELAGIIKLLACSSFRLFECRKFVTTSRSSEAAGSEEYIELDDNKYIGDLLAEFMLTKDGSEGKISECQLTFKRKSFREWDEAITDPMFVLLSYVQLKHDYILGYYPVGDSDAVLLSALQILVATGDDDTLSDWRLLIEGSLPRQIAKTRAEGEWERDIRKHYHYMNYLAQEDARQIFLRILGKLRFGNSVFFKVFKIYDSSRLLPGRIILGVNKRGVHIYGIADQNYVHTAYLKDIELFASDKTSVIFRIRMEANKDFQRLKFETKQGEEICAALQTYITDAILLLHIKANPACVFGDNSDDDSEPPNVDASEIEEPQKLADQIWLLEKQKHQVSKLQIKVEELTQKLAAKESSLNAKQVFRKQQFNNMEDLKGKIKVYCRLRPLTAKEISDNERNVFISVDKFTVQHLEDGKSYLYNHVFDGDATQEDVFNDTKYLVQSAVDGYNASIFAYGQTGSGKTYTIYGFENNPGLIPQAACELLKIKELDPEKFKLSLKAYMVELYQDTLKGLLLLEQANPPKLEIRKDSKGVVTVQNATNLPINEYKDLREIIQRGTNQCHMNKESSRSNLIFSIIVEGENTENGLISHGKLSFVDLAGFESVKTSLGEDKIIDKSLSALDDVIWALYLDNPHIPYTNDKLTMLLSDSLGGNAKTLMFVNISPAESNLEESCNSLDYATRVRSIVNYPSKNISSKKIAKLKEKIERLRRQAGGDDEALLEN